MVRRGRALAGIQGNTSENFLRTLGRIGVDRILFDEKMQDLPKQEGTIQIYLENEKIKLKMGSINNGVGLSRLE